MKNGRVFFIMGVLLALVFLGGTTATAQSIKVGVIYPLTGQAAAYGEDGKQACQLAQDEINAAGGINGRKVEFLFEDDAGTPKGGVSAAQKLIEIDKVNAIIGPLFSSVVLAIKSISATNKIPIIAPLSSHPDIFGEKGFAFSLDAASDEVGYVEAKYWREEKKMNRAATLYVMADNPLAQVKSFEKAWKGFGGVVVASESFNEGAADFRMQLTKIKARKPDFILLRGSYGDLIKVIRQMAELNMKVLLEADTQVTVDAFLDAVGPIVDGRLTVVAFGEITSAESKSKRAVFESAFKVRFNADPQIVAYHTYDACYLLFSAMKTGGVTGEPLRAALAKASLEGVSGSFQMQSNGMSGRALTMNLLTGGKFVPTGYVAGKR